MFYSIVQDTLFGCYRPRKNELIYFRNITCNNFVFDLSYYKEVIYNLQCYILDFVIIFVIL